MKAKKAKPITKKIGGNLFSDIRHLVSETKQCVAIGVNEELTSLYWQVGNRIRIDLLKEKRAVYGQKIVATLSQQLTETFGKGWSTKHLQHCLRFAETFQKAQIVSALRRQLTWTHLKTIMYMEDELKREFYIEMVKMEKWNSRLLQERINSMLYERTAISKNPEETIRRDLLLLKDEQILTPELIFRDPYFLDFLGL